MQVSATNLVLGLTAVFAVLLMLLAKFKVSGNVFAVASVTGFTVIAAALILYMALNHRSAAERYSYLKKSGQRITATIVGIQQDNHIRLNYRSPYIIVGQWTDPATHTTHTFRSRGFWDKYDPAFQLRNYNTIDVYVERGNYDHYYVDLSSVGL
jgi:hypothetical protein